MIGNDVRNFEHNLLIKILVDFLANVLHYVWTTYQANQRKK